MSASLLTALLVMTSPVPVPAKLAEAAPEFNRPPRDQRAKLLDVAEFAVPAYPAPFWQDGGKRLLLLSEYGETDGGGRVALGGVEIVRGFGTAHPFIGRLGDGGQWVEYVSRGSGINSYHRLVTRPFGDGTDRAANRAAKPLASVEFDRTDGVPAAVTPDGKTVFTLGYTPTAGPGDGRMARPTFSYFVRALDGAGGEPQRTVAKIDAPSEEYKGHAFNADRTRLFLAAFIPTGFVIRAVDTSNGKPVWERTFDGPRASAGVYSPYRMRLTANGGTLAATAILSTAPPPAPRPGGFGPGPPPGGARRENVARIHLLDTATGKDRIELDEQGTGLNSVHAVSPDGRLVAGQLRDKEQDGVTARGVKLAVWDSKSGKVLKAWEYTYTTQDVFVTFHPTKPLMVLHQPGGDKSVGTIGVWDLSGLLK